MLRMGKSSPIIVSLFFTLIAVLPPQLCFGGDRVRYPEPEKTSAYLSWVLDGKASKQEVFDKLGWPDACFLDNKILIYNLYGSSEKDVHKFAGKYTSFWVGFPNVYSLQLVFESSKLANKEHKDNFLMRHSLVKIRTQVSGFSYESTYPEYPGPREKSCMD